MFFCDKNGQSVAVVKVIPKATDKHGLISKIFDVAVQETCLSDPVISLDYPSLRTRANAILMNFY